jgi:hypothetical protein
MAITPYSTPVQYQYKPLNLMAFAEPLMKMQEKYDLTKASLDEADVKATSLQFGTDPERRKALEQIYRTKRDELTQTLLETSNYTQVASKLKQLNKLWNEDPERLALEANYKTFAERDKEELARVGVGEGKITKQQYLQWRADEIRKYEDADGTNFRADKEAPGGTTYNTITGTIGRTADMSKEMQELMFKTADAIQAKKYTSAMQGLGIDPTVGDAKFKVTDYENLSRAEIEAKVEEYIKQQDRFKPWLVEKADYDFKDIVYAKDGGAKYNQVAKDLLGRNYAANEQYIQNAEKLKKEKSKDFNEENYQKALLNRDFLLQQMENPDQGVVRDLFVQSEMNRQYDASALGKIFEVNNSKTNYTFRDLPSDGDGSGSGGIFDPKTGAIVNPTVDAKSYTSLQQTFSKGKSGALAAVRTNNNIGKDPTFAIRQITMGKKGTTLRKQMEANPALALPRQQQMLAVFQQSTNAADFKNKLIKAGFSSADSENAATAWKLLSNENTRQAIANNIQGGMEDYNNMEVAMNLMDEADRVALTDKKFLGQVAALGTETHTVSEGTVLEFAKLTGKSVEELIRMGAVEHTPARYAKEVSIPAQYKLSGNRIARLYGYQTLEQAVANGVDFKGKGISGLGNNIVRLQKDASSRLYSAQEMGQVFSNDAKVDKVLTGLIPNAESLVSFVPAGGKWDNVPGFSEDGSPMAGTTIAGPPRIGVRGNQVYLHVTYNYKNPLDVLGKGTLQTTVEVRPKPENKVYVNESLNRIAVNAYQSKDESAASKQVFETAANALYNSMTENAPTRELGRNAEVSSTNREAVLQSIPGDAGKSYQIVKRWQGEGVNPVYVAKVVGPGGSATLKQDGKEVKSNDIESIKVYLSEMLFIQ